MFDFLLRGGDLKVLVTQATGVMFVAWWALYFAAYPISRTFWKKSFNSLNQYQQYEWCSRLVSTVHALIAIGLAYWTMLFEEALRTPDIPFPERMTWGVSVTAATTLSYWIYDLMLIIRYWKDTPDYAMVAHHLCGIIPFALGSYFSEFVAFAPTIIIAETSTPFVNARWFMYVTNNQGTLAYAVNGLCMWLSFLLCRIWWLPYGLSDLMVNFMPYATKYHLSVLIPVAIGTPIAYALSFYWFLLITKGLVKTVWGMIKGSNSSSSSSTSPSSSSSSTLEAMNKKKLKTQ